MRCLPEGETEVKSLIPPHVRRKGPAFVWLVAAIILAMPSASRAQQVVAFVNGQPITVLDIEHRSKFIQMSSKKVPSRKEVMDSLIDEILEIAEAKRFGLDIPDADIDRSYADVATRMAIDAQKLTQILVSGGASEDTLKRRLRAQMAWTALVRGRYKASLEIRDKDVEAQLELHKTDEKSAVGYEYIMRPVVFIVARGSADAVYEARKRDAEALRARFVTCDEGITFARALPDVAVRDQVVKIFRRPCPATSRHSGWNRYRPPDAAGADRGRNTDVRDLRKKGNQVRHAGDAANSRADASAEIRRAGQTLSREFAARGDDRIQTARR